MRSLRYLNTVLTLIAVLLTLHLWTLWMGGPTGSSAPMPDLATEARAQGLVNAGAQRKQIVGQLKLMNQKTDQLMGLFKSGKAQVRVKGGQGKRKADG